MVALNGSLIFVQLTVHRNHLAVIIDLVWTLAIHLCCVYTPMFMQRRGAGRRGGGVGEGGGGVRCGIHPMDGDRECCR